MLLILWAALCIAAKQSTHQTFFFLLIFFFAALGALWIRPLAGDTHRKETSAPRIFRMRVDSFPRESSVRRSFYAVIEDSQDGSFSERALVYDYSSVPVSYRGSYLVRGRLQHTSYSGRPFSILWLKNNAYRGELPVSLYRRIGMCMDKVVHGYCKQYLSPHAYSFLASVLLGRRELIAPETKAAFIESGLAHLFAISGLHVGIIGCIFIFIFSLLRVPYRARLLLSAVLVIFYVLFVGVRASTLRASVMYTIFALSMVLERKVHPLNTLGLAGLVCLFIDPLWIYDIGFQLSFLSAGALIFGFMAVPLSASRTSQVYTYLKGILLSSLFVGAAIAPLTAFYFNRISILGLVYNTFMIPLFTLVIMCSFVFLSVWWAPPLAECAAAAVSYLVSFFTGLTGYLAHITGTAAPVRMSGWGVFFYYLAALCCVAFVFFVRRRYALRGVAAKSKKPPCCALKGYRESV